MAQLNFDASQVAPDVGFGDPIPDAWYNAMIDDSEIKPTKTNATDGGAYLNLRFNIIDGEYKGRKVFGRFNIRNSNPTAQEIGYKQLSAVAHAVGVLMVQDSQQLHGIPLKIKVKVRAAQKNPDGSVLYEANNEISSYKNINEATPATMGTPGAAPGAPGGGFGNFAPPNPAAFGSPAPAAVAPAGFAAFAAPAAAAPVAPAFAAPAAAAPAAVAPPAFVPPAAPVLAPPVAAPVVEAFPPAGWTQHPQSPTHYYQGTEVVTEAELRARMAPPAAAPVAPPAFAAPPVAAPAAAPVAAGPAPAAAQSLAPPWARPAA